ncbi:class I SAM-dependent methyltransferase [Microbacterium sp. NPDC076911]|uniref:SAM-dependent methyltransferase n=1 Tax=Microbacterium sp. NPDC076911 TaxID=3154958 RepID=UPI003415D050
MTTVDQSMDDSIKDPTEFWEARYLSQRGESGHVWSGGVNAAVEREVEGLAPGKALDLGCGEGADALWMAAKGWTVTAIDISATALAVGAAAAVERGLSDRIEWVQADLASWHPSETYDLVSAAFLHSPVALPREVILRRVASAVEPGGRLLIVGHGAFPSGAVHGDHDQDAVPLPTPDEVLAALDLPDSWAIETKKHVDRPVAWRDGTDLTLVDTILKVRRPAGT